MKKSFCFLIFCYFSFGIFAQNQENLAKHQSSTAKNLDKELAKIYKNSKFPAFAVGIIQDEKIVFGKGYGFANIDKKIPYTYQTIQPIASVSKTFIALAVMKAIEQGYFTMETDINALLPFPIKNPNFPNDVITIHHLVTHTSGLLDNDTTYIQAYHLGKKPKIILGDFMKAYYTPTGDFYKKHNFSTQKAGQSFAYSNIASALTAYIVECATKIPFDIYTQKHIFEPLRMNDSHWFFSEKKAENYATLYEIHAQTIPLYKELLEKNNSLKTYSCDTYPDGSLKTSLQDLCVYMLEMLKGMEGKGTLLRPENYKILFAQKFSQDNMPKNMLAKEPNRAVFWAYNKSNNIIHTGGDAGVSAFVSIDPKTKTSKIILFNTQLDGEDNIKTVENFKKITTLLNEYVLKKF